MSGSTQKIVGAAALVFGLYTRNPKLIVYGAGLIAGGRSQEKAEKEASRLERSSDKRNFREFILKSAVAPHNIIYGATWTGGVIVYENTADSRESGDLADLYNVIVHCAHEVEGIDQILYDDQPCINSQADAPSETTDGQLISGDNGTIIPNNFYVVDDEVSPSESSYAIELHFGSETQNTSALLAAAFPTDFPTNSPETHTGRGLAYTVHRFRASFSTISAFASGPPRTIRAFIRGRKIYDPRKDSTNGGSGSHRYTNSSTWEYSSNPILCCLDYLANYAKNPIPYTEFDYSTISTSATVCDVQVASPSDDSPQIANNRYECNGELSLADADIDNVTKILSSCMGSLSKSSGKWHIRAGYNISISGTINESDIFGAVSVSRKPKRDGRYNTVKGVYFNNNYVSTDPLPTPLATAVLTPHPTEFLPLTDANFLSRDNGVELVKRIDLPMTTDEYAAQRIAYKVLQQSDFQMRCTLPLSWKGLRFKPGDNIQVNYSPYSWVNKEFTIVSMQVNGSAAPVVLSLIEDGSQAWADPALDDYSIRNDDGTITPASESVIAPTNLDAEGTYDGVRVSWINPNTVKWDSVRVYASANSSFNNASVVFDGRTNEFLHTVATTRYYWVRTVYKGEESIREPNSDTSTIFAARLPRPVQDSVLRDYVLSRNWVYFNEYVRSTSGAYRGVYAEEIGLFIYGNNRPGTKQPILISNDGINLTIPDLSQLVTEEDFKAVAYSPELARVIVISFDGSTTEILNTSDGINWGITTLSTSPTSTQWYDACWSPELSLFVAVALDGLIMTSSNGYDWTVVENLLPTYSLRLFSVCWSPELGLFCGVGNNLGSASPIARVALSSDGSTWTVYDEGSLIDWSDVCWADSLGLFVASSSNNTAQCIMTSPDGQNWTVRTASHNASRFVNWSQEQERLVGVDLQSGKIMYSDNGTSWTEATNPTNSTGSAFAGTPVYSEKLNLWSFPIRILDDTVSPNVFRMTGLVSKDGANWFYQTPLNSWKGVCWSEKTGKLVAVGSSGTGNRAIYTTTGMIWLAGSGVIDNNWTSVCYSNFAGFTISAPFLFVAVSSNTNSPLDNVMTSPDGETWTSRQGASGSAWQSVCWSDFLSLYIAVASNNNDVMTSSNGITWTSRNGVISAYSVCSADELGLVCAVGAPSGTPSPNVDSVQTSTNGITWTSRNAADSSTYRSVCWSPEQLIFCAVGDGGAIMTSPDGASWTARTAPQSLDFKGVCWSRELGCFVAVADSGSNIRAAASADGITWVNFRLKQLRDWQAVAWSNGLGTFTAVADDGVRPAIMNSVSAYTFPYNNTLTFQGLR